jgi:hypothetical protein
MLSPSFESVCCVISNARVMKTGCTRTIRSETRHQQLSQVFLIWGYYLPWMSYAHLIVRVVSLLLVESWSDVSVLGVV